MQRWWKLIFGSIGIAVLAIALVAAGFGWRPWDVYQSFLHSNLPPIRIGLLHSQTGDLALSEKSLLDVEIMAIEEINAAGGVGGRKVVYSSPDCRSEAKVFAAEARRLLEQEKVAVLFGGWTSESRKVIIPVLEEFQSLLFFPGNFEGLERSTRVIYAGGVANQSVLPAVRWAYDSLNARKFYVVGLEEVWSRCSSEIAKDAVKAAGAQTVGEGYTIAQKPEIGPIVEAIRQARPDVVLNFLYGESNLAFYAAMRKAGMGADKQSVIAYGFAEDEARRFPQADVVNQYAAWNYFQSVDRPENKAFLEKFRKRFDRPPVVGDPMVAAYNSIKFWARSANEVGPDNIAALIPNLLRQSMNAPDGIVTIDGDSQAFWRPFNLGRLLPSGQFEIIWSIDKPIRPVVYVGTRSMEQWNSFLESLRDRWRGRWSANAADAPESSPSSR